MAEHQRPPALLLPGDSGVYILWLRLARLEVVRVGRFGRFALYPGVYAYCGSAQRHLAARLARHHRAFKRFRWHVDYLRARCRHIGTMVFPLEKAGECWLAQGLVKHAQMQRPVEKFGASDCRCAGHLAYAVSMQECQWEAVRKHLVTPLDGRELIG